MSRSNFSAQIVASSDTRTSWVLMRIRPSDRSTDPTRRKSECSWLPVSRRVPGSFLNANDEVRERTSRPWIVVSWRMISSVSPSAKSPLSGSDPRFFSGRTAIDGEWALGQSAKTAAPQTTSSVAAAIRASRPRRGRAFR